MYSCSVNVREMKKMDALIYEMYMKAVTRVMSVSVANICWVICQV